MTPKRTHPLTAQVELEVVEDDQREIADERTRRFSEGISRLRIGNVSSGLNQRLLLVVGGVFAFVGLGAVLVGWYGASQTPYLFEQVPYLISGGLLGLGLVFLGGFMYFAHWLTELVREHRAQSQAILAALDRLHDDLQELGADELRPQLRARVNGR